VKNPKVLVLMSTYNGERFLREQLDSILSQQDVEISLLVRDDGSKDNTCQILSDYASKHQNVIWKSFENVGFVKSFSALIRMANTSDIDADFYAFADQDDIWMSNKLATACTVLATKDNSKPTSSLQTPCRLMQMDVSWNLFTKGPSLSSGRVTYSFLGLSRGVVWCSIRKR
jgi:glycosyltransferase involved in cell wall biosynthesis